MHTYLKVTDMKECCVLTTRQVQVHLQDLARHMINKALADGILERARPDYGW